MACKIFYKGEMYESTEKLDEAIKENASLQEHNQLAVLGANMLKEERLLIADVPITAQKTIVTNLANRIYHNLSQTKSGKIDELLRKELAEMQERVPYFNSLIDYCNYYSDLLGFSSKQVQDENTGELITKEVQLTPEEFESFYSQIPLQFKSKIEIKSNDDIRTIITTVNEFAQTGLKAVSSFNNSEQFDTILRAVYYNLHKMKNVQIDNDLLNDIADLSDVEGNLDVELDPDSKGVQLGRDAITINPASTIGEELRSLLTGIEQIGTSVFMTPQGLAAHPYVVEDPSGLAAVYNYETLFNEMLVDMYNYFKDKPFTYAYEDFREAMQSLSQKKPWYKQLMQRLDNSPKGEQAKIQFAKKLTDDVVNFEDHMIRNSDNTIQSYTVSSSYFSTSRSIVNEWQAAFMLTPLVNDATGEALIVPAAALSLRDEWKELQKLAAKSDTTNEDIAPKFAELLGKLGITLDNLTLTVMRKRGIRVGKYVQTLKKFISEGYTVKTIIKELDKVSEGPINISNTSWLFDSSNIFTLAQFEQRISNRKESLVFKNAEGKSIYALNEPKYAPTLLRLLKNTVQTDNGLGSPLITSWIDNNIEILKALPFVNQLLRRDADNNIIRSNGLVLIKPALIEPLSLSYYGGISKDYSTAKGRSMNKMSKTDAEVARITDMFSWQGQVRSADTINEAMDCNIIYPTMSGSTLSVVFKINHWPFEIHHLQDETGNISGLGTNGTGRTQVSQASAIKLFEALVEPELARVRYATNHTSRFKNIDKHANTIFSIPQLNESFMVGNENYSLFVVKDNKRVLHPALMDTNSESYLNIKAAACSFIAELYTEKVANKLDEWFNMGIIEDVELNSGETRRRINYIDSGVLSYFADKKFGINDLRKIVDDDTMLQLAYDLAANFVLNNEIALGQIGAMFVGDPLNFVKEDAETKNGKPNYIALSQSTMANIMKRLASHRANRQPAARLSRDFNVNIRYIVTNEANPVAGEYSTNQIEAYRLLFKDSPNKLNQINAYAKFEEDNAGERVTLIEHLTRVYCNGEFPSGLYKLITDFVRNHISTTEKEVNGERVTISKEDRHNYWQPLMEYLASIKLPDGNSAKEVFESFMFKGLKPIYNAHVTEEGINPYIYVKTASIPLLPTMTMSMEMDKMRIAMEELEMQTTTNENGDTVYYGAAWITPDGLKAGVLKNIPQTYDSTRHFVDENLGKLAYIDVPRDWHGIQQDKPLQEHEHGISATQSIILKYANILDKDFRFQGKSYKGSQLRDYELKLYKTLFQRGYEDLMDTMTDEHGNLMINEVINMMYIEMLTRPGYSVADIELVQSLKNLKETQMALTFSSKAVKFQQLLCSMVDNRVRKQLNNGTSRTLSAETGWILPKGMTPDKFLETYKGDIIWTKPYSNLQHQAIVYKDANGVEQIATEDNYARLKSEGKLYVRPSQVIISSTLPDGHGGYLDLREKIGNEYKWLRKQGEALILDLDKISPELLKLWMFRIPTQGPNSANTIEIVGFLPQNVQNIVMVSKDLIVQTGADFDFDTGYFFTYLAEQYYENPAHVNELKAIRDELMNSLDVKRPSELNPEQYAELKRLGSIRKELSKTYAKRFKSEEFLAAIPELFVKFKETVVNDYGKTRTGREILSTKVKPATLISALKNMTDDEVYELNQTDYKTLRHDYSDENGNIKDYVTFEKKRVLKNLFTMFTADRSTGYAEISNNIKDITAQMDTIGNNIAAVKEYNRIRNTNLRLGKIASIREDEYDEDASDAAIKNTIVDIHHAIYSSTDLDVQRQIVTPLDYGTLMNPYKDHKKNTVDPGDAELIKLTDKRFSSGKNKLFTFYDSDNQRDMFESEVSGIAARGIFSLVNKLITSMQGTDMYLVNNKGDEFITRFGKRKSTRLGNPKTDENEDKSWITSGYQAASFDEAKFGLLAASNYNPATNSAFIYMVTAGFGSEANFLMSQPIIRDYANNFKEYQSLTSTVHGNRKKTAAIDAANNYSSNVVVTESDIDDLGTDELFFLLLNRTNKITDEFKDIIKTLKRKRNLTYEKMYDYVDGIKKTSNDTFIKSITTLEWLRLINVNYDSKIMQQYMSADNAGVYNAIQLGLLRKFEEITRMGDQINNLTSVNVDSGGIPKNLIESLGRETRIRELLNSKVKNSYQLLGEKQTVTIDQADELISNPEYMFLNTVGADKAEVLKFTTIHGLAFGYALRTNNSLWAQLFPLLSPQMQVIIDDIYKLKKPGDMQFMTAGTSEVIKITDSMISYLFTSAEAGITNDPELQLRHLLKESYQMYLPKGAYLGDTRRFYSLEEYNNIINNTPIDDTYLFIDQDKQPEMVPTSTALYNIIKRVREAGMLKQNSVIQALQSVASKKGRVATGVITMRLAEAINDGEEIQRALDFISLFDKGTTVEHQILGYINDSHLFVPLTKRVLVNGNYQAESLSRQQIFALEAEGYKPYTTLTLGTELIQYGYLTGGRGLYNGLAALIPKSYLKVSGFYDRLSNFMINPDGSMSANMLYAFGADDSNVPAPFKVQHMQHFPNDAPTTIPSVKDMAKGINTIQYLTYNQGNVVVGKHNNYSGIQINDPESLGIPYSNGSIQWPWFVKQKDEKAHLKWRLYMYEPGSEGVYWAIPVLGSSDFSEYSYTMKSTEIKKSIVTANNPTNFVNPLRNVIDLHPERRNILVNDLISRMPSRKQEVLNMLHLSTQQLAYVSPLKSFIDNLRITDVTNVDLEAVIVENADRLASEGLTLESAMEALNIYNNSLSDLVALEAAQGEVYTSPTYGTVLVLNNANGTLRAFNLDTHEIVSIPNNETLKYSHSITTTEDSHGNTVLVYNPAQLRPLIIDADTGLVVYDSDVRLTERVAILRSLGINELENVLYPELYLSDLGELKSAERMPMHYKAGDTITIDNKVVGTYVLRDNIKSTKAAIRLGVRTSTSRTKDAKSAYKPGQLVVTDLTSEWSPILRIKTVANKTHNQRRTTPAEWSEKEGWMPEAFLMAPWIQHEYAVDFEYVGEAKLDRNGKVQYMSKDQYRVLFDENGVALTNRNHPTDLALPKNLTVVQNPMPGYEARTKQCIADAELTVIISSFSTEEFEEAIRNPEDKTISPGTRNTYKWAKQMDANVLVSNRDVEEIYQHIINNGVKSVNFAGPRLIGKNGEVAQMGNHAWTYDLLKRIKEVMPKFTVITGGQSGVDLAFTRAAVQLGLKVKVNAPGNWQFQNYSGYTVKDSEFGYKSRLIWSEPKQYKTPKAKVQYKYTKVEGVGRSTAELNKQTLYIFADNLQRSTGNNIVPNTSKYYRDYNENRSTAQGEMFYPGLGVQQLRGLDNSLPITVSNTDPYSVHPLDVMIKDTQWKLYETVYEKEFKAITDVIDQYNNVVLVGVDLESNPILKHFATKYGFTTDNAFVPEEISSKGSLLGKALSPVAYTKSKYNHATNYDITPSFSLKDPLTVNHDDNLSPKMLEQDKGDTFGHYYGRSVEGWYQANKTNDLASNIDLMQKLLADKLRQGDETYLEDGSIVNLMDELQSRGGVDFILASTHLAGSKSIWSSGQDNLFLKCLAVAYQNVLEERQTEDESAAMDQLRVSTVNRPLIVNTLAATINGIKFVNVSTKFGFINYGVYNRRTDSEDSLNEITVHNLSEFLGAFTGHQEYLIINIEPELRKYMRENKDSTAVKRLLKYREMLIAAGTSIQFQDYVDDKYKPKFVNQGKISNIQHIFSPYNSAALKAKTLQSKNLAAPINVNANPILRFAEVVMRTGINNGVDSEYTKSFAKMLINNPELLGNLSVQVNPDESVKHFAYSQSTHTILIPARYGTIDLVQLGNSGMANQIFHEIIHGVTVNKIMPIYDVASDTFDWSRARALGYSKELLNTIGELYDLYKLLQTTYGKELAVYKQAMADRNIHIRNNDAAKLKTVETHLQNNLKYYALVNFKEFLTMSFTDKSFQELMRNSYKDMASGVITNLAKSGIKENSYTNNTWTSLVDIIRRIWKLFTSGTKEISPNIVMDKIMSIAAAKDNIFNNVSDAMLYKDLVSLRNLLEATTEWRSLDKTLNANDSDILSLDKHQDLRAIVFKLQQEGYDLYVNGKLDLPSIRVAVYSAMANRFSKLNPFEYKSVLVKSSLEILRTLPIDQQTILTQKLNNLQTIIDCGM